MSMVSQLSTRLIVLPVLLGLAALLSACGIPPPSKSGELVIGIREAPGFYQRENDVEVGYEYDLVTAFAERHGLNPRFVVASGPQELDDWLKSHRIHLAAALPLPATASSATSKLAYSVPIRQVGQLVVGLVDDFEPENLAELAGHPIKVLAGSEIATTLRSLPQPPVVIEVAGSDEFGLLSSITLEYGMLAAVHDIHFDLALRVEPDLQLLLQLPGKVAMGWAFAGVEADDLKAKADAFIAESTADRTLARIHDRHFGHIKRINRAGAAQFIEDMQRKLPEYRREFQIAEELTGLDWRLIAALAYQESKWDPLATSYTNVRGMMMLTEDTADHLGVKNRLDARDSIRAGSRYLLELISQIPETTPYPDRIWLALSAYNMGMGHFRGALAVAKTMKRDSDDWYEMKQVLPQLARPEVYARLKSGKARGGEAVIMVENIRTYFDILSRLEPAYIRPFSITPSKPQKPPTRSSAKAHTRSVTKQ